MNAKSNVQSEKKSFPRSFKKTLSSSLFLEKPFENKINYIIPTRYTSTEELIKSPRTGVMSYAFEGGFFSFTLRKGKNIQRTYDVKLLLDPELNLKRLERTLYNFHNVVQLEGDLASERK